jgi:hypothetical protein
MLVDHHGMHGEHKRGGKEHRRSMSKMLLDAYFLALFCDSVFSVAKAAGSFVHKQTLLLYEFHRRELGTTGRGSNLLGPDNCFCSFLSGTCGDTHPSLLKRNTGQSV